MYSRIPWELLPDALGSAEHTFRSNELTCFTLFYFAFAGKLRDITSIRPLPLLPKIFPNRHSQIFLSSKHRILRCRVRNEINNKTSLLLATLLLVTVLLNTRGNKSTQYWMITYEFNHIRILSFRIITYVYKFIIWNIFVINRLTTVSLNLINRQLI
jgi:hypothetical protein